MRSISGAKSFPTGFKALTVETRKHTGDLKTSSAELPLFLWEGVNGQDYSTSWMHAL